MATRLLRHLYMPEFMIKKHLKQGELPSTREAYSLAFGTAWAAITETFLIALISVADTVMVGSVGEAAIAAVGLCNQPRFIVQSLVMSMNVAITSICARRRGQDDRYGALCCLKQGLLLSAVCSVLLTGIALLFTDQMIWFVGAQDDTFDMARTYYQIILLGIPLNNLSLTISAAQRGVGNTKVSMWINMSANAIKLFFNLMLIDGAWIFPRLGVRGAAISTIIGWASGLVIAIFSVSHANQYFHIFTRDGWKPDRPLLRSIFMVTSGSFSEQLCMRVGFLIYARIVAALGTTILAAHIILQNILSLSFSFGEGFGIAASSLVGQNLGRKRVDLAILFGKVCQRMSILSSIAVSLLFTFAGTQLILLFTDMREIIDASRPILMLMSVIVLGQSSQMVFMGSLRGAGDTRYTAIISLISIVILRPIMSYWLGYGVGWGLLGVWFGFMLDQFLRLVLTYRRFSSGHWSKIEL